MKPTSTTFVASGLRLALALLATTSALMCGPADREPAGSASGGLYIVSTHAMRGDSLSGSARSSRSGFGFCLAAAGDVDRDGVPDVLVAGRDALWLVFLGRDGEPRSHQLLWDGSDGLTDEQVASLACARSGESTWIAFATNKGDPPARTVRLLQVDPRGDVQALDVVPRPEGATRSFGRSICAVTRPDGDATAFLLGDFGDERGTVWRLPLTGSRTPEAVDVEADSPAFDSGGATIGSLLAAFPPSGGNPYQLAMSDYRFQWGRSIWLLRTEDDGRAARIAHEIGIESLGAPEDSTFGYSIASCGDVFADGAADLLTGVLSRGSAGTEYGVALLDVLPGGGVGKTSWIAGPLADSGLPHDSASYLGTSLAGLGDVDGNGTPDIALSFKSLGGWPSPDAAVLIVLLGRE